MTSSARHFAIIANDAFSLINFRGPLMAAIQKRGWRVTALAPNFTDKTRDAVRALGCEPVDYSLNRTGTNPASDIASVVHLVRLLRRLNPDRVFAFAIKPVIYGMLAARLAGIRRCFGLVAGLGYAFADEKSANLRARVVRSAAQGLARLGMNCAEELFFQNPDDLNDLVRWGIIAAEKGRVIGATGIDLDVWAQKPLIEGPPTFLLAARMVREKGIVEFAEAARRVKADHPDARFILLGGLDSNPNGLDEATIRSWTHVVWLGHVTDMAEWLVRSSIFVLPSYYREGVPRSTQEAMAIGRAVITTDWPGCRETVVAEDNGLLIPVRSVEALEVAMRRFTDDTTLASRMGARSRELAVQRFDVNQINARLIEAMDL